MEIAGHFFQSAQPKRRPQAGDKIETFAACLEEGGLCSHADLLNALKAVADEGGADNQHASDFLLGQAGQFQVGVRLEPRLHPPHLPRVLGSLQTRQTGGRPHHSGKKCKEPANPGGQHGVYCFKCELKFVFERERNKGGCNLWS